MITGELCIRSVQSQYIQFIPQLNRKRIGPKSKIPNEHQPAFSVVLLNPQVKQHRDLLSRTNETVCVWWPFELKHCCKAD